MTRSRRTFLAQIAAAPLAPLPLERRGPPKRVLILGGGLAGLCCAYELQNQGHQATVLEAQRRPGGRVHTLRDGFPPGLQVEAGAESIPDAHDLTLHYAKTFGLTLLPSGDARLKSFYHVRGQRILPADDSVWPFALTDDERRLGLAGLRRKYVDAAVQRALAAGYPQNPIEAMREWDEQTPGGWLRAQGASAGATELLTLGFGSDFGSAASFLLHRLNTLGSAAYYRIEGGNDLLPFAFARKVDIRYGAIVSAVTQDDRSVTVSVRTPAGRETLTADAAVCTLPCPVIGTLFRTARLSAAKLRAIEQQSYSHTAKVFLQTRTRFWIPEGFSGNVTTDLPIERLTPDPGTEAAGRGALTACPVGPYADELQQMSESDRIAAALASAGRIFPALHQSCEGGVSKCWGLDPFERGSFALHTPGQIGFLETLSRPEGRIHFAGEHTSVWTGWMQGALDSARRVLREIN